MKIKNIAYLFKTKKEKTQHQNLRVAFDNGKVIFISLFDNGKGLNSSLFVHDIKGNTEIKLTLEPEKEGV